MNDHPTPDLNQLRAAVLGANDGVVSVASIVVGVAAAAVSRHIVLTAGVAGLVAGALSMAAGEYVSVSSQRDTEQALLDRERRELAEDPHGELKELTAIYEGKGLHPTTAKQVAHELSAHDVERAHFEAELGIDPEALTNPWAAAIASAVSFTLGGIIPLGAVLIPPVGARVPVTFVAVFFTLILTGYLSGRVSRASKTRAIVRVVIGGLAAMAVTYGIGHALGLGTGSLQ